MTTMRPTATSYTEADRAQARRLFTIALQYIAYEEPEYAVAEIARVLSATWADGYDTGSRASGDGWPSRECNHDAGECYNARHGDPDWPHTYPCPECGGNGCAGCGGSGEKSG